MSFGKVQYNKKGNPICEICGEAFIRLIPHVYMKHGLTGREYKKRFGLPLVRGILSEESRRKSIVNAIDNFFDKKELLWATPRFFQPGHPFYPTAPHLRKAIIEKANKARKQRERDESFMQWLKKLKNE